MEKHEAEVRKTMTKLEQVGYRLNPKKLGQQGIRPLQNKLEAITKISIPKKTKKC